MSRGVVIAVVVGFIGLTIKGIISIQSFFGGLCVGVIMLFLFKPRFIDDTSKLMQTFGSHEKSRGIKVDEFIDGYNDLQNDSKTKLEDRNSNYSKLVNAYYELATMFYEWGWGQSFHFAYRLPGENFYESIKRHEYFLASKLQVRKGDKLLDCGCGVGGPYRNIAHFTGCDITGVTINEYQVIRGNILNQQMGLNTQCRSVQGDFMNLKFDDESFDGVYAIEATCHAPDRKVVFNEIKRVLKPGKLFVCYEWCLTDKYDKNNPDHRLFKKMIEEGDGLPDTATTHEVIKSLNDVGFEVLEACDIVEDTPKDGLPWYHPLTPSYNVLTQRFQFTPIGLKLTTNMLWFLEKIRLAPQGTHKVQTMLQQGAVGLSRSGELEIFTPMFLCVARKPL